MCNSRVGGVLTDCIHAQPFAKMCKKPARGRSPSVVLHVEDGKEMYSELVSTGYVNRL